MGPLVLWISTNTRLHWPLVSLPVSPKIYFFPLPHLSLVPFKTFQPKCSSLWMLKKLFVPVWKNTACCNWNVWACDLWFIVVIYCVCVLVEFKLKHHSSIHWWELSFLNSSASSIWRLTGNQKLGVLSASKSFKELKSPRSWGPIHIINQVSQKM